MVNRVIAERRLASRGESQPLPAKLTWMHDWQGDAAIGMLIGLVVYCGGIPDVSSGKVIVAAAIGGVSGATYFTKIKEVSEARRQVGRESAKTRVLKKASEKALGASYKEEGNGKESANSE